MTDYGIPLTPPSDDRNAPDLARQLAGGDRSSSALSLMVRRASMFTLQPLDLEKKQFWGLFYERLRNGGEVLVATVVGWNIYSAGVAWGRGLLVSLDITIFPSFFDAPEGNVPVPSPDEPPRGGHQVTLIGADFSKEVFGFDHLFSPDWGQDGQGSLPFTYVDTHVTGAIAVRASGGPKPTETSPESDLSDKEPLHVGDGQQRINSPRLQYLIDHYRQDEPESEWLLQHEDDDVVWMGRRLIGAGNGDLWIQGALLVRGILERPLLVGWMFCRLVTDDVVDVEEFFVWPPYRCKGYGTALAGRTLLYAAGFARCVRWIETIADAVVNARVPARIPAWILEFSWHSSEESGWGVTRVTDEIDLKPLLARLGNLHVPGGAHLLWTDGTVHVAPHDLSPEFGLVIATEVPPP